MMAEKRTTNLASDAFRKHYDILYSALASQPDLVLGLSAKLYKRVVITQDTRDSIQLTTGVTPGYQASRLLQAVEANIRINPRNLRRFSRVLKKEPTLKRISEALRDCYRTLVSVARQVLSSSSESETELTDNKTSDGQEKETGDVEDSDDEETDDAENDAISMQIEEFEMRFEDLAYRARVAIEEHTPIKKLTNTLQLLPLSIRRDHLQFLLSSLPNIEKAESIDEIFRYLNMYWSFIDYHLLEHLIKRYGSKSLKAKMGRYVRDLAEFRSRTTIAQVCGLAKVWSIREDLPQHFSRLSTKFNKKASEYTLEELEQFRKSFCREFSLKDAVAMLAGATDGSVILFWHIPSSIVSDLTTAILSHPHSFFEHQLLVEIDLDGICVYNAQQAFLSSPRSEGDVTNADVDVRTVDGNTVLGEDDLLDVKRELLGSCYRWSELGLGLRIKPAEIEAIRAEKLTPEGGLTAVLLRFLRKDYNVKMFGEPTWRRLIEVVQDPSGGKNPALAQEIAEKYLAESFVSPKQETQAPPPPVYTTPPLTDVSPPQPANGVLDLHVFSRLRNDLDQVAYRWFELGIQLDIEDGDLNAIDADSGRAAAGLRQVIRHFLKNTDDADRKEKLIKAMKSDSVGETRRGSELEKELQPPLTTKKLITALNDVTANWHCLGIQLDIPPGKLKEFETYSRDVKRCFSDMLELWWKQDKGPKIVNLVTALRDIDEKRLAGELEKKYRGYTIQGDSEESDADSGCEG